MPLPLMALLAGAGKAQTALGVGSSLLGIGRSLFGKKKKKAPAQPQYSAMDSQVSADRNRYLDMLSGGQQALNTSASAAMESAMPQFKQQLQGLRESAIRRGISNGETATSYEGDLASALQRNVANSVAGQATNMYGTQLSGARDLYQTGLDEKYGLMDRATAADNARRGSRDSLIGSVLGAAGTIGGAVMSRPGAAGSVMDRLTGRRKRPTTASLRPRINMTPSMTPMRGR